eukprot:6139070-Prymnesium_polylepis.1
MPRSHCAPAPRCGTTGNMDKTGKDRHSAHRPLLAAAAAAGVVGGMWAMWCGAGAGESSAT